VWGLFGIYIYDSVICTIDCLCISVVEELCSSTFCNETVHVWMVSVTSLVKEDCSLTFCSKAAHVCVVFMTSSCCWGSLLLGKGDIEGMAIW